MQMSGPISRPKKSRSILFTSAAFPALDALDALWPEPKEGRKSLPGIRSTKTHTFALLTGCSKNGDGAEKCKALGAELEARTGVPVIYWDERRTTIEAHQILNESNYHGKKRKNTVDAVAASLILEGYLAYLRNQKE